jgi:Fe-S-cluster-containing dehydrogenase component
MRVVYVSSQYNEQGVALRDAHSDDLVLLLDMDRCIGCGACRMACQAESGEAFDSQARRIAVERRQGKPGKLVTLPTTCRGCADPCDYIGNEYWTVCPADKTGTYTGPLCDGCAARVSKGLTPACATRCAMKCLHIGRAADIRFALEEKRLRSMGEAEFRP